MTESFITTCIAERLNRHDDDLESARNLPADERRAVTVEAVIALAGKQVTPGGAIEIALLLGRDESLRRLESALTRLVD